MFAKIIAAPLFAFVSVLLLSVPVFAQSDTPTPSEILIEILQDDAARAALIEQLQQAAPTAAVVAAREQTIAQQVVSELTGLANAASSVVDRTVDEIGRVLNLWNTMPSGGVTLSPQMVTMLWVIGAVIVASWLSKLGLARVIANNPMTALTPIATRIRLIVFYAMLRFVGLTIAWGAGYAAALTRNNWSAVSTTEMIFLIAVLVFGLCRIALRLVVTPDGEHEPALSHLHPRAQETIYRQLRGLIAALTFSFMFILPLVREWIGFATVRPVRTVLATILLVMAIVTIKRIAVVLLAAQDADDANQTGTGAALSRGAQSLWRSAWPPLAAIYVIYCWLIAVTRPRQLSDIVLGGTVWTIGAVLMALVALWLTRLVPTLQLDVPTPAARIMPDLARRLSGVARLLCGVLAALLAGAAVLVALSAWSVVAVDDIIQDPDAQLIFWRIVSAILLGCTLAVMWAVIASFIDQRLRGAAMVDNSRARTLLGLFRNAFTIVVAVLGVMVVLSQLGVDIAPLLAGAGVIGLAIGFGSQKLVQDIITGVFIQLENAINEGDVVGVAGITGGVEKLSIRSVLLRTLDGSVHIVPFSSVDTVTNLTRDFSFHVAELGVAYKEKVPDVIAAMQAAFDTLRAGPLGVHIIDDFEMHGITALGDSSVVVRARIKTKPGQQWGVGRAYTALVKDEFDGRGIEIPYPHRQLMLPPEFVDAMSKRSGEDVTSKRSGDEAKVIEP